MSIYYKLNYVDPAPIYSEVKEMLSSYFNAGSIDDVLFPKWTEHCLKRFGKVEYPIKEAVIEISGYEACVPEDFNSVRELWACTTHFSNPVVDPSACYYQTDCRIEPITDDPCHECYGPREDCTLRYMVLNKVTGFHIYSFTRTHLLRPGNMNAKNCCANDCRNLSAQGPHTFDIVNGKIITNSPDGCLHLIYYANNDGENKVVPDNFWVQDYIRKYIIYMCFLQLSNQITDETFNQIQQKLIKAEQDKNIAFITAMNELKKQTLEESVRRIGYSYRRFSNRYRL